MRNFPKRVGISIALLALPAVAALAAEAPDQPLGVMEQPRPEYQAHGVALFDNWILLPSLAERVNYDNNVFRSLLIGGAPSDWFLESTPVVRVQRKTDTTAIGLSGGLDNLAYARFHQLDLTDWSISADGSVNLAHDDFSASGAASYGEYHEGFESAEVTRLLQQGTYTRYFRSHVDGVANYNPDNWRLSAGASYDSFDWQPTELRQRDGGITSFSNRNRDESLANPFLRAGYQLTPDYQVFVRAIYDSRSFLSLP
ncbi:MAG: outer membrane beta-barrel protein, partial [Rhizomicrobium sp.]